MGSLQAREMASLLSLEQSITWHLRSNHVPPVPVSMVPVCIEAIGAYWEDDLDKLISLPEGVYYRGSNQAPARAIIINHHLDAWCEDGEDE